MRLAIGSEMLDTRRLRWAFLFKSSNCGGWQGNRSLIGSAQLTHSVNGEPKSCPAFRILPTLASRPTYHSQILEQLVVEGYIVEPEAIAALSPYWTHHVNRFGSYQLDLERHPPTINYDAAVVSANLIPLTES
jgi:hypothetical protein